MAIFHCSIKIIGRSQGRSAVACAAYRSGTKLFDEELQKQNDYTNKAGVVHSAVLLPENAPDEFNDREKLWNAVHQIEKQSNAQLAREVEVALPRELSWDQQIALVHDYVQEQFVKKGMAADYAIHDKGDGNPHAHIMLTTRGFKANGQWEAKEKKDYARDENGERIPVIDPATGEQKLDSRNRKQWQRVTVQANDWNSHENAELWRANWARACNQSLQQIGSTERIDHRSFARQGKEQEPTIHEGYEARQMEARGEVSERCEYNRQVKERNRLLVMLKHEKEKIERAVAMLKDKIQEYLDMHRKQPQTEQGGRTVSQAERQGWYEVGKLAGIEKAEIDTFCEQAERGTPWSEKQAAWNGYKAAQEQFWQEYNTRKAELQKDIKKAYKTRQKVKNAYWLTDPRNHRKTLLGVIYAGIVIAKNNSLPAIDREIEQLKQARADLYSDMAAFKENAGTVRGLLKKQDIRLDGYIDALKTLQGKADRMYQQAEHEQKKSGYSWVDDLIKRADAQKAKKPQQSQGKSKGKEPDIEKSSQDYIDRLKQNMRNELKNGNNRSR